MYIGSTGPRGLHHLVYEIVDNSIDEALAGYCKDIIVEILPGDVIRVTDNGRGIPVGVEHKTGLPAVTVVLTVLHAGGKFGGGGYKYSGGLHGVGSSVVNALSEWLEVEVCTGGHRYQQRFERGKIATDLKVIGDTDKTGTTITFKADPLMFEETVYGRETLLTRLREQAFLNAGLHIELQDKREEEPEIFSMCYEGGISSFVEYENEKRKVGVLHNEVIHISVTNEDNTAEVALQYNDSYNELILSFANNIRTIEGGTHVDGFKAALTKVLNEYARRYKILKDNDKNLEGADFREGITAVISVKLTEAQFEGQTKGKLGNTFMRGIVNNLMTEKFAEYLEEHPAVAKVILEKAIGAARAREAARKAKEAT
ncbi:MAG: DNA topoisomerase IV subunit B, partial [Oscillospiraceae bacterium]|nr:DNA topoisomerase IV subunit B [Oscillospiraceae bacterium]